ncbi:MAG: UMP kinase [Chlamydiae bacterium]|nr:UMP kinase [Chlamydiota bacterium]
MSLFRRVLLKLSGEALTNDHGIGSNCSHVAKEVQKIHKLGIEIAIVIGAGNLIRGNQSKELSIDRTAADQAGMLATIINGILLEQALKKLKIQSQILSAIDCQFFPKYEWGFAKKNLQEKTVVIFVGGTGHPFFTTDTAAALRASEIDAEIILKATTKVDGIYSDDPIKNPKAKKYPKLTFSEALAQNLKVMDAAAFALCRENQIPIYVFNLFAKDSLLNVVLGKGQGSLISED